MISYELCKRLKDAGFPFTKCSNTQECCREESCYGSLHDPTLSELIEACGEKFKHLVHEKNTTSLDEWYASDGTHVWKEDASWGMTPEDAVANLWLAINEKKV